MVASVGVVHFVDDVEVQLEQDTSLITFASFMQMEIATRNLASILIVVREYQKMRKEAFVHIISMGSVCSASDAETCISLDPLECVLYVSQAFQEKESNSLDISTIVDIFE